MKERFLKVVSDADENQEAQFNTWFSGQGIPFVSSEAEAEYQYVEKEYMKADEYPDLIDDPSVFRRIHQSTF